MSGPFLFLMHILPNDGLGFFGSAIRGSAPRFPGPPIMQIPVVSLIPTLPTMIDCLPLKVN
jgi:hypothetical protein